MLKTYMLDTNVLLTSPFAFHAFDEHKVIVSDVTIAELDNFKTLSGEKGANAREAIRQLEEFRLMGDLMQGVRIPETGGLLMVATNHVATQLLPGWSTDSPDNRILRICKGLREDTGEEVTLVSNDTAMRVKASLLGINAEPFKTDRSEKLEEQYKGRKLVHVAAGAIDRFYSSGGLKVSDICQEDQEDLFCNEFLTLLDEGSGASALAQYDGKEIKPLRHLNAQPWGVTAKNSGQRFYQEALLAPADKIPLVIAKGPAGTAKTFLALACGLEQTVGVDTPYKKILVVRPNIKMDEDIGYLKGSERDKIDPLIRPIYDNLETLAALKEKGKDGDEKSQRVLNYADYLFDQDYIDAQALAYMRGRSVTNTYLIVDEAQNMSTTQAFGIVSRVGFGTKVILCGDPEQIDNPRLDSRTNGLSFAAERMKGSPLCQQITFDPVESVRSPLAKAAISLMRPKGYLNQ